MKDWRMLCRISVVICSLMILGGCVSREHTVQISSKPPGATVSFNNEILGETPLSTTIKQRAGDYNIYVFTAQKNEYHPAQKSFKEQLYNETVSDVVPEEIVFEMEKREQYHIKISSEPTDAMVIFNGDEIGSTPMTATVMEHIGVVRNFEFMVSKDGYEPQTEMLQEYIEEEGEKPFQFPEKIHFILEPKK